MSITSDRRRAISRLYEAFNAAAEPLELWPIDWTPPEPEDAAHMTLDDWRDVLGDFLDEAIHVLLNPDVPDDPDPALCASCQVDTQGDGTNEFYMVTKEVWNVVAPDDQHHMDMFLCIGCVEERLGRRLTSYDFTDVPLNAEALLFSTPRLIDRLTTPVLSPAVRASLEAYSSHIRRPAADEGPPSPS